MFTSSTILIVKKERLALAVILSHYLKNYNEAELDDAYLHHPMRLSKKSIKKIYKTTNAENTKGAHDVRGAGAARRLRG